MMARFLGWLGAHVGETIALCALGFTAWQAWVQRRHNVISVKPHITTFVNRNRNQSAGHLEVKVMNNGLGPAFIDKFQVYLSGQPCEANAAVNSLLKGLRVNTSITTLGDDYAMPSGEARTLLAVTFPCTSQDDPEKMAERLDSLDLELHYSSAYGQKFKYDSRKSRKTRLRDLSAA